MSGSVASLRYVTAEIIELAKRSGITVFIIGHITKEGQLAGPKTLEHMVDAVLYFQGETQTDIRLLRAEKNRFGPLNEIGIFQMSEKGLTSVNDPSQVLIQNRQSQAPGHRHFPGHERHAPAADRDPGPGQRKPLCRQPAPHRHRLRQLPPVHAASRSSKKN